MKFTQNTRAGQLFIALLCMTPFQAQAANSWNNNWVKGITAGFLTGAGLYWLFRPFSTEEIKKNAEECYTDATKVYAELLNKQRNNKELLANTRQIGQNRYRGFWRSIFTGDDNHLGSDAQHRSPLLRGAACMEDDAEQLLKNMKKLDERCGSIHAAEREFYNYKNMLALRASLLTVAQKIKKTRDYATAQESFAQYRENKKLQEEANARLARIEYNMNKPKVESTSYFFFSEEKPAVKPLPAREPAPYRHSPVYVPAFPSVPKQTKPTQQEKPAAAQPAQRPPAYNPSYQPMYPDLTKPEMPEPSAPEL